MTKRRQKGTGSLHKNAKTGMWVGVVDLGTGPDGVRRRKYVYSKNQKTAQRKLTEELQKANEQGDLVTAGMTVEKWLTYWLDNIAAPRIRPRTLAAYRSHVGNYLIPVLGRRRLESLQPQHVREVHAHVASLGLSSTTGMHAHVLLVKALTDARREGLVSRNVAELVDAPNRAAANVRPLTTAEAKHLLLTLDEAGDPYVARWAMALLTGQRQGECLGLEIDRVLDDRLDISWQLQRLAYRHGCGDNAGTAKAPVWPCGMRKGGYCRERRLVTPPGFEIRETTSPGLFLTRPKTRERLIPLVEPFRTILYAAIGDRTDGLVWHRGLVMGDGPRSTKARDESWPIDPADDNHAWHAALTAAGLPSVELHAARHTTATWLLELGVDPKVIGQMLGQSSVVTTRGYQHVSMALATEAAERVGRALTAGGPAGA